MSRNVLAVSWRLQAVANGGAEALPEAALRAFHEAGGLLQQPGAFEGCAVVVESQAFSVLTGFHPQTGELIDSGVVRRAAEAATAGRVKALTRCGGGGATDYVALGVFLRVCAAQGLALRVSIHPGRRRGL